MAEEFEAGGQKTARCHSKEDADESGGHNELRAVETKDAAR